MSSQHTRRSADLAIWQDVEFGSYAGDLPAWERLADASPGPVLELGAGSGRVALHLARRGASVIAVEREPELAAALSGRAAQQDLPVEVIEGDVRSLATVALDPSPALAIAPLHLIQQIEPVDRPGVLELLAGILGSGGVLAVTLVDERSFLEDGVSSDDAPAARPDMREVDRWVYSSEPLWVQVAESTLMVRRLRQVVSPEGDLRRSVADELLHRLTPDSFEEEAARAGFERIERLAIPTGSREADSVAVVVTVP